MRKDNKQYSIEDIFRRKMENHEIQTDFSDWDIIRERLPRPVSPTKRWLYIGSGIAALVALIITYFSISEPKNESQFFVTKYSFPNQQEEVSVGQESEPSVLEQENITSEILSCKQNVSVILKKKNQLLEKTDSLLFATNSVMTKEQDIQSDEELSVETVEKNNDGVLKTTDSYQQNMTHKAIVNSKRLFKKDRQKKWVLSSLLGTNKVLPDKSQYDYPKKNNNVYSDIWAAWGGGYPESHESEDLINDNANVTHLPPFSFGLTVRRQLNSRLGIETGLIYTYLSSTYKWYEGTEREFVQQLHYIGIPVNGIVVLCDNSKWGTYASVGAMLEKGVRRKVSKDSPTMILPSIYNQGKSIDGLQWSVSGSIGLNYHLSRKVGIYFEPRISYYFKNNQPRSIRTDCPISVGFGLGIQYSL